MRCAVLCVFLLVVLLATCPADTGGSAPLLLSYHDHGGGFSQYGAIDVSFRPDGSGSVVINMNGNKAWTMPITLDIGEMNLLRERVGQSKFFQISAADATTSGLDAGSYDLGVTLDGRTRELHLQVPSEQLRPLLAFVDRVVNQATVTMELESGGNAAVALGALLPSPASPKVLQPRALKKPLEDYIRRPTDGGKLSWAVEALALVATPDEWCDVMVSAYSNADGDRKERLLYPVVAAMWNGGNMPKSHVQAAKSFMLQALRLDYGRWDKLSKYTQADLGTGIQCLGTEAIPTLLEADPARYEAHDSDMSWGLAGGGGIRIPPVVALLSHRDAAVRAAAATVLGRMMETRPDFMDQRHILAADRDAALGYLRKSVVPLLKTLSESDSDPQVRAAAKLAQDRISMGWGWASAK